MTDSNRLTQDMNELMEKAQVILKDVLNDEGDNLYLSINNLLELWMEFSRHTVSNPAELSEVQISYWQDFLLLCKDLNFRLKENIVATNPAMRKNVLLSFVEKYYFMLAQHVVLVIKKIFSETEDENVEQITFHNNHFMQALLKNAFVHIDSERLESWKGQFVV